MLYVNGIENVKICSKCHLEKSIFEFPKSGNMCKLCIKLRKRQRSKSDDFSFKNAISLTKSRCKFIETRVENSLTLEQWNKIIENQKNRCAICNRKFSAKLKPTMDHIIPLSKGGGLTFENVQALCKSCNSSKHANLDYNNIITWVSV